MRVFLLAVALAATACGKSPAPVATPGYCVDVEEDQIAALFDRWNAALRSGSPDRVEALYTTDALLLPLSSGAPRQTADARREYFRAFLALRPGARVDERRIRIGCNSAFDAGISTFVFRSGERIRARYTFTYAYDGTRWRITSDHVSRLPESNQASGSW